MSNSQVGKVFEQVIQDVCNASLVDFEEGGVGTGAMDDLKAGWEKRLTELHVATFPWDPTPPPQPAALAVPTTIPSNGPKPNLQSLPSNNAPMPLAPPPHSMPGPPRIKSEAPSNIGPPTLPPLNGLPAASSQTAQQRAAINLQQRYGAQAQSQVERLQQAGHRPQTMPMPMPPPVNQDPQNYASAPVPQPQRPAVSNAQTDGAGDSLAEWKAEVARRRAAAAKAGAEPDHFLMDQMREAARRMEGGGLMVPLDEYTSSMTGSQLKTFNQSRLPKGEAASGAKTTYQELVEAQYAGSEALPGPMKTNLMKAQYDGPASDGDADVPDEDAINSDLDDPDDIIEGSDAEEEGGAGADIMLCTYDKVQRVKNKWKCTLKDGLMTTGSKEYVFHKAQGEFEW